MQLRYNIVFILLFVFFTANAKKTPKYPVNLIASELKDAADAVVRDVDIHLEVFSESKIVRTEKYVITILKESGLDKAEFIEGYDKFSNISDIDATVYDADGFKIKSISSSEIRDYCSISGFSLYEDNRVKFIDPKCTSYPFTVEYSYKQKFNSSYYIHGWSGFSGYNTSTEKLRFKITYPKDFPIHYKELNLTEKGVQNEEPEDMLSIEWSLNNLKAPLYEKYSSYRETWVPSVKIATDRFELDGYNGDFESWQNFGNFIKSLNKGKDNIPQETVDQVSSLLNDNMTDYERICEIYGFVQKKNRYVSVQVGIGGLQPFDAETVDRLSYGDCKALSNYTVSLLKKFGYDAQYVIVYAGNKPAYYDLDFIKHFGNHAIACVPLENDTVWLECTSPYNPCGYLGDFTDDRDVLLVTEEGGKMVKTPAFSVADNNQSIKGEFVVNEDGQAVGQTTYTYKGALYGDEYGLVLKDEIDRRKAIIKSIDIPHFELLDYNIFPHKERKPWIDKKVKILIPGFATKMGERLFFPINTLNKSSRVPSYSRNRKTPMLLSRPYSENDTINYVIPEGYKMEALPNAAELHTEFGSYFSSAVAEGNKIVYHREFKIYKGEYPKEKYNDFVEFLESVAKFDGAKAVLIKES